MISPSSALANWLRGTSTFLLTPRMSVNWSRRKSTPNSARELEDFILAGPGEIGREAAQRARLGLRHSVASLRCALRRERKRGEPRRVRWSGASHPFTFLPQ